MASGPASTDAPLIDRARAGIRNLVCEVADVQPGEQVLILSEYGRVEKELPDLIGEAVKEAGGEYQVMWADPLEPGRDSPPKVLMAAMLAADKIIYNVPAGTPGQMPVAPVRYLEKDKGPLRVTSNFCSVEHIATEHATFSWRVVRGIYDLLEEMATSAKTWHVGTATGTELGGRIAKVSSRAVILEEQRSPFAITFPVRVHCPVGVVDVAGVLAIDHQAMPPIKIETPPRVVFENDRVARVEGGREADEYRKALEANEQRWGEKANYLDSWHGGLHPYAPNVPGFIGHGSCARMHFHVGRSDTYTGAGIISHTLTVDDRTIVDRGKLVLLEDPEVRKAVGL